MTCGRLILGQLPVVGVLEVADAVLFQVGWLFHVTPVSVQEASSG
jgi:hypothetical protein